MGRKCKIPVELKIKAVEKYLDGKGSLSDICIKYKILSDFQLRSWTKVYNGHKEFKGHNSSGGNLMTKGRKTTYEERLKIVTDCIGSNYDYISYYNNSRYQEKLECMTPAEFNVHNKNAA